MGTAVVAGTAGVIHHHQNKKYAEDDYEDQQAMQQEANDEPAQQQAAPAPEKDMADELERLAALHDQGALSDEEFATAKQQLLDG